MLTLLILVGIAVQLWVIIWCLFVVVRLRKYLTGERLRLEAQKVAKLSDLEETIRRGHEKISDLETWKLTKRKSNGLHQS